MINLNELADEIKVMCGLLDPTLHIYTIYGLLSLRSITNKGYKPILRIQTRYIDHTPVSIVLLNNYITLPITYSNKDRLLLWVRLTLLKYIKESNNELKSIGSI